VANDRVAGEPLRRTMMTAAVPKSIRVVIASMDELAEQVNSGTFSDQRVLLLFETAADALHGHQLGLPF